MRGDHDIVAFLAPRVHLALVPFSRLKGKKSSAVLKLSFYNGIFFFIARLTNNFFFCINFLPTKLAKIKISKNMCTFLLCLMRIYSEVATMTFDLWCKRFTGKKIREAFIT